MRYLVRGRVKPGRERALLAAIERGTLGSGSVAEGEYLRNMRDARELPGGETRWVEVCYCAEPLQEERPYWEEFFDLVKVQDAHDRRRCRDQNGTQPWACGDCDCTARLEQKLRSSGNSFLCRLRDRVQPGEEEGAAPSSLLNSLYKYFFDELTAPTMLRLFCVASHKSLMGGTLRFCNRPNLLMGNE